VAINDLGQVAGDYLSPVGKFVGFVQAGTTFTTIDPDPADSSTTVFVTGINHSGNVVGYFTNSSGHSVGFVESGGNYAAGTAGTYTIIAPPGSTNTILTGINDSNELVGYYTDSSGQKHVFVENGGNYAAGIEGTDTGVNLPGAFDPLGPRIAGFGGIPDRSLSINNSGQIVGDYIDSSGTVHGFVDTPVPTAALTVTISDAATVFEGSTGPLFANFTVTLSSASQDTITVDYATRDGTADAGTNYQAESDTITFARGQTTATISIPIISTLLAQHDETFTVVLSNPTDSNGTTPSISHGTGTGTIDALFTTGPDEVKFNDLFPSQVAAITAGADLYHSLGGADRVSLPANGTALAPGIMWDSSQIFSIGSPSSVGLQPGDDGATIHSGPSNDLIDGAYETNAQFGGAANQRGDVVFTNGDTVEFSGSFTNYTIKELTGGDLEVKDNRGIDGTDILKDIAFLKFDGTTIPAPGRELETVSHANAGSWLASATGGAPVTATALNLIDWGKNTRWAADPGTNDYTITWSMVTDPSKLPADYLGNSGEGVTSLTPLTAAAHAAIVQIFANIHKFLPNVTFQPADSTDQRNTF
jgi:hypothetical protein